MAAEPEGRAWSLAWSVKTSKLCNLRCRYCYEWNDLANPARMSLDQWAKILTAALRYHEVQGERFGRPGQTHIVWHGGEPLLLPLPYWESVIRLEHEILGREALERGDFVNFVQTNLYSLDDRRLDLLQRERFEIAVSLDFHPGLRVTAAGHETEDRVQANLRRLLDRGLSVSGSVVIAGHTRKRLRQIYDAYEGLGLRFSLFPLFRAPLNTAEAPFSVTDGEIVEALKDLFVYWMSRGAALAVEPLQTYLHNVLLRMAGLKRLPYDRREYGDRVIVVDTDGSLYSIVDRYLPGRSLGNIFGQTLDEILASREYGESLARDDQSRDRRCRTCPHLGACDTYPAFSVPDQPELGRCRIAHEVQTFIHRFLRGVRESELVASTAARNALRFSLGTSMCREIGRAQRLSRPYSKSPWDRGHTPLSRQGVAQ